CRLWHDASDRGMRRRGFAGSSRGAWRRVRTKNAAQPAARRGSLTSWPILPDSRPSAGRGVPPPEIRKRGTDVGPGEKRRESKRTVWAGIAHDQAGGPVTAPLAKPGKGADRLSNF